MGLRVEHPQKLINAIQASVVFPPNINGVSFAIHAQIIM